MSTPVPPASTLELPGYVRCAPAAGGLPRIAISNHLGEAHVYLHGATITHFQPRGQAPVLWTSAQSLYVADKPIRGGVPICWPWFGPRTSAPGAAPLPVHGFARIRAWTPLSAAQLADGRTRVELELRDDEATRALFPYAFALRLTVTVGTALEIELTATNRDAVPFAYEDALHSYLAVGDVRQVAVEGLDGVAYVDKTDRLRLKVQEGPLRIAAETDRVHLTATAEATVDDPAGRRRLVITKSGSACTVVWNPWIAKAKAMADFGDEEWPGMLCVEAANCLDRAVTLLPGTSHTTRQVIAVG